MYHIEFALYFSMNRYTLCNNVCILQLLYVYLYHRKGVNIALLTLKH